MSIEDLKTDLASNKSNCKELIAKGIVTPMELARHMLDFWAFQENVITEIEDLDGTVRDLYDNAEDLLQPETSAVFAAIIAGGLGLINELEKRLTPADAKIRAAISEFKKLAKEGGEILVEVTIPDDDDDDEEEDDEDEDDDDDADEIANNDNIVPEVK